MNFLSVALFQFLPAPIVPVMCNVSILPLSLFLKDTNVSTFTLPDLIPSSIIAEVKPDKLVFFFNLITASSSTVIAVSCLIISPASTEEFDNSFELLFDERIVEPTTNVNSVPAIN